MIKVFKTLALATSLIFAISCSDSDDGSGGGSISNQDLEGTIFGENFTATGGKAFDTSFGDTQSVSINITNEDVGCESSIFDYDLYVSTNVPFEEGTFSESNVVFHSGNETPLNVLQSTVIIEEITDTTITVQISSESFDGESMVEGTFVVDYCE